MTTTLKTGFTTSAVLVALLAPGAGAADAKPAPEPIRAAGLVAECRQSPTLVEQWLRHGEPLPPCVREHDLAQRHDGDDHRQSR